MSKKQMSKSIEEYFSNNGWSSHKFLPIAKEIFPILLESSIEIVIGRSVIHLSYQGKLLKIYVHHDGLSNDWMTILEEGDISTFFHCTDDSKKILDHILRAFKINNIVLIDKN